MMNLRQLASALAATALLNGSLTAAAEPDRPHRTTRAGGVSMVEPAGAPEGPRKPTLRLIFSNFDKPPAAFQGGGFSVLGPANTDGSGKQFVAVPFVPKYDTSVTAIALAVNHEPGSSVQKNVRVSLYADAAGAPGAVLEFWPVAAVADYATSNFSYVSVTTAQSSGIPLTTGATYWVAVDTDAGSDFSGWWSNNSANTQGTVAYWNDYVATWKPLTFTVPALAVYGHPR